MVKSVLQLNVMFGCVLCSTMADLSILDLVSVEWLVYPI